MLQERFKQRVLIFESAGEMQFFKDPKLWGHDGLLGTATFSLILTDKPFGINKKDGSSSDKAIPDDEAREICKDWFGKLPRTGTVCVRLAIHQVHMWQEFLRSAGFLVEVNPTVTLRVPESNRWARINQFGQRAVGYVYVIAHKVQLFLFVFIVPALPLSLV